MIQTLVDCQTNVNQTVDKPTDKPDGDWHTWMTMLMMLVVVIGSVLTIVIWSLCLCQRESQLSKSHQTFKKQSKRIRSESQSEVKSKTSSPRMDSNEMKSLTKSDSKSDPKDSKEYQSQTRTESSGNRRQCSIVSNIDL